MKFWYNSENNFIVNPNLSLKFPKNTSALLIVYSELIQSWIKWFRNYWSRLFKNVLNNSYPSSFLFTWFNFVFSISINPSYLYILFWMPSKTMIISSLASLYIKRFRLIWTRQKTIKVVGSITPLAFIWVWQPSDVMTFGLYYWSCLTNDKNIVKNL